MASQKKRGEARSAPAPATVKRPANGFRLSHVVALLVLAAIALIAYSNSFYDGNTLDNYTLLRLDKRIQQATAQNISDILSHTYWWPFGESGLYRPLATLSYLFNYAILGEGEKTFGYHAVNLLLHFGNVALLYFLGLRLLGTRGRAFALAAIWSVHPVLTESVTNMVGRPDLLAGLGVLGGFLCYLIATDEATAASRRWIALAGIALATAIGVFSKESGVTVIGVIVVYELVWWKERRGAKGRIAALAAAAAPILVMLLVRMQVMSGTAPANFPFLDNPLVKAGFVNSRLTALAVMARYLWRLICPVTLSADYSYDQIPLSTGTLSDWISWIAIAVLIVVVIKLYRWNRTAFFFAAFAAVTFVPMSNLLFPIGTIMAERFLYLPAAAFCACLVLAWGAMPARVRAVAPIVAGTLVAAYAVRTWMRNPDWANDLAMAQSLVKTSPNSFKVRKMLAFHLYRDVPNHRDLDQVIANAEAGLAILNPLPDSDNNAEAYRFAGGYYFEKGEDLRRRDANGDWIVTPASTPAYQKATELFDRAISIMGWANPDPAKLAAAQPDSVAGDAYRILSLTYQRLNDLPKAQEAATRAVQLDPLAVDKYLQLARVQLLANQLDGAAATLFQGSTLTSAPRLATDLMNLYRSSPLNSDGCAIAETAQGPGLNAHCASVKRILCPAIQNSIRIRLRTGRPDLAQELTRVAQQQYACPVQN